MQRGLVGSEMCIRDRYQRRVHGGVQILKVRLLDMGLFKREANIETSTEIGISEIKEKVNDSLDNHQINMKTSFKRKNLLLFDVKDIKYIICLLYTSPSPRDLSTSRMPSSA
eukprot:TRINITY_DN2044_c0_g1_i4.p2 TRINITY_DN2044_c0_g1~~TRINITY_DN2044_c0_g1_i4.p2  ORF type:complete len:112 (-),score=31.83 TRINITY_DN2044_c0_g1_i4:23-358(-)